MNRKTGSKSRGQDCQAPCNEDCAKRPGHGCFTIAIKKYRDFSKYISHNDIHGESDPTIKDQVEEVCFRWLAKKKADSFWYPKFLSDKKRFQPVFQRILDDQRGCIQHSPNSTKIMPFGSLDSGYIVRYKNPWDFHVILEHQPLYWSDGDNTHEKIETWKKYFSGEKMSFQSGVDLFRGLTAFLSRYMEFWHEEEQKINSAIKSKKKMTRYQKGDLLICVVPREDDNETNQWIMLGFRAVVVENNLTVMTMHGDQVMEGNCMRLYFLDTGENRVVEQDSDFVAPLPEVFSIFRPLVSIYAML